jgi:hypothetical protein
MATRAIISHLNNVIMVHSYVPQCGQLIGRIEANFNVAYMTGYWQKGTG